MTGRKPGAPPGNRNAAKAGPNGLALSLYLNGAEIAVLDALLAERGEDAPTDETRRAAARELLRRAIRDVARAQDTSHAPLVI